MQPRRSAGGDKRQAGPGTALHLTCSESTLILGLPAGAHSPPHPEATAGAQPARGATLGGSTPGHGRHPPPPPPRRALSPAQFTSPSKGPGSAPASLAEFTDPAPLRDTPQVFLLLPLLCPPPQQGKMRNCGPSGDRRGLWGGWSRHRAHGSRCGGRAASVGRGTPG